MFSNCDHFNAPFLHRRAPRGPRKSEAKQNKNERLLSRKIHERPRVRGSAGLRKNEEQEAEEEDEETEVLLAVRGFVPERCAGAWKSRLALPACRAALEEHGAREVRSLAPGARTVSACVYVCARARGGGGGGGGR